MQRNETKRGRTRRFAIAAVAIATLAAGGVAAARPHGPGCGEGRRSKLEKLERDLADLGLAKTELDSAYEVIDRSRKDRRALETEIRAAHERMRELLEQDAPDADAVAAQADTIGALMTQMRKIELRTSIQVRAMLTPEQRSELDRRRERHMSMRRTERE